MTGGLKINDVENIRMQIIQFVGKNRKRIMTQLFKVDKSRNIRDNTTAAELNTEIAQKWNGDINDLILHIYENRIGTNANNATYPDDTKLQEYLIGLDDNYPVKDDHSKDKIVLDKIFMIVVIALCKVYGIIKITQN
jgi:hypothetical protein